MAIGIDPSHSGDFVETHVFPTQNGHGGQQECASARFGRYSLGARQARGGFDCQRGRQDVGHLTSFA